MDSEEQIQYQLGMDRLRDQQALEAQKATQPPSQDKDKMGLGIFLVALILSILADVVELITLGTIGWLVGFFVDLILLAIIGFSKGVQKQWKKIVGAVVGESIPFINTLPIRTIFVVWSFISSRR